jgi:hypothetical protein
MPMTKVEAGNRHPVLGIMRPGESFEISADPDEVRHLRNEVARFRETMKFSVRKTDTGYRCTCIGDRI